MQASTDLCWKGDSAISQACYSMSLILSCHTTRQNNLRNGQCVAEILSLKTKKYLFTSKVKRQKEREKQRNTARCWITPRTAMAGSCETRNSIWVFMQGARAQSCGSYVAALHGTLAGSQIPGRAGQLGLQRTLQYGTSSPEVTSH